ncbi:hypothetical protein TNCV_1834641 [Trichonephila clavipes]|nr:hypothetical protein TNCV_1834641 [Trichonephila clavipes]
MKPQLSNGNDTEDAMPIHYAFMLFWGSVDLNAHTLDDCSIQTTKTRYVKGLVHVKSVDCWRGVVGSLDREAPAQVSSSSLDRSSKLRDSSDLLAH